MKRGGHRNLQMTFVHVAETSVHRKGLGGVDRSYHRYPFELLFSKSYDRISTYRLITTLASNLIRHPTDLVVLPGYHRPEYWVMLFICILRRRKRAVFCDSTAYDTEKFFWKEWAKAFFFRRCDGFFCYGTRSKAYVAGYGIDERRIYDGCQAAALPPTYDAAAVLSHFSPDHSEPVAAKFLYVGRLAEEKGLFDLLNAFSALLKSVPSATLDIVGAGVLREPLMARVHSLSMDSAVSFLGHKEPEEIGRLLTASTAMVLPSHREPWGLVVNEALSFGCPVVVSNICGCVPELVKSGITGYSYPVGDVSALTRSMIDVLHLAINRRFVAKSCLDLVAKYSSASAAQEILRGCVCILETPQ